MKLCFVLGTRPEIIKLFPVIKECEKNNLNFILIHTNQHYDYNLDEVFFEELNMKKPDYNLGVGSGTQGIQLAKMFVEIEKILIKEMPDYVIVQGDTNSVFSGALIAKRLGIKVAHIEAGLRSYDLSMPEEQNRIYVDHISDFLFVPTITQKNTLISENINSEKIFITGNTIVDSVNFISSKIKFENSNLNLLTLHRPENTDNKIRLQKIINNLEKIAEKNNFKYIFPIHPRTKNKLKLFGINLNPNFFKIINPISYVSMLSLIKNSNVVFTDSGGIQEESCILKVPSLNLRTTTERPECINVGSSKIVSDNYENLSLFYTEFTNIKKRNWKNPFGDGNISRKIIKILLKNE